MNLIHLLWIVPLAFWLGFCFAAFTISLVAQEEDNDRRTWVDD